MDSWVMAKNKFCEVTVTSDLQISSVDACATSEEISFTAKKRNVFSHGCHRGNKKGEVKELNKKLYTFKNRNNACCCCGWMWTLEADVCSETGIFHLLQWMYPHMSDCCHNIKMTERFLFLFLCKTNAKPEMFSIKLNNLTYFIKSTQDFNTVKQLYTHTQSPYLI